MVHMCIYIYVLRICKGGLLGSTFGECQYFVAPDMTNALKTGGGPYQRFWHNPTAPEGVLGVLFDCSPERALRPIDPSLRGEPSTSALRDWLPLIESLDGRLAAPAIET